MMLWGLYDWLLLSNKSDFYEGSLCIVKICFSCFPCVMLFLKFYNERVFMSACFERWSLWAPSRVSKLFRFPFCFRAIKFFCSSLYFGAWMTFWADKTLDWTGNNCFLFKSLTVKKLDAVFSKELLVYLLSFFISDPGGLLVSIKSNKSAFWTDVFALLTFYFGCDCSFFMNWVL